MSAPYFLTLRTSRTSARPSLALLSLLCFAACATEEAPGRGTDAGVSNGPGGNAAADAASNLPAPIQPPPGSANDARAPDDNACARAELQTTRVIPKVWLLVDGSGSMGAPLALTGASRWALLRDALMAPGTGLVARLEGSVAFGLMVYDGGLSPPGVYSPLCPRVVAVEPAVGNYAAINAAYPATETGASTPTHYALLELRRRIETAAPGPLGPTFVVLATDGKPNLCDFHDGIPASQATEQEAVTTVAQLSSQGTKVFAISMASEDPELQAHLQALALAGDTGQSVFSPASQDALASALTAIVGGAASCDVRVDGTIVEGRECAGDVKLNGMQLACNDANGYRLKADRQTLELVGSACAALQTSAQPKLSATFPCADVILR